MKTLRSLILLIAAFSIILPAGAQAQTTLAVGDISITGFNANAPDNFAFVTWVPLENTTYIKFTDCGFLSSSASNAASNFRGTENYVIWQNNTGSTIAAGTVIKIEALTASLGACTAGSASGLGGISSSGDQVIAYQGAATSGTTPDADSANFTGTALFGLNFGSAWLTTGTASSNTSYLPSDLNVAGGNIVFSANGTTSGQYTGSRTNQTSVAAYKSLVNNPANWTTLATAASTTIDTTAFTLPATVAINDVTVAEGDSGSTVFTFTVTRSDNTGAFTVDFATADDTATAGSDYVANSGTLTFAASGDLTETVAVTVNGDTTFEPTEVFFVNLSNVQNASGTAVISDAQGAGTIVGDDFNTLTSASIDVLAANTGAWNPAGVTINGTTFVNLGLQGVGRIPANAIDPATGESIGSISDMQISGWKKNLDGSFSGSFHFLPDRGYNSGAIYSNYAARINDFAFNFTPYTGTVPITAQNQVAMTFAGSRRFGYDHDGDPGTPPIFSTGLLATGKATLFGTEVPVTAAATTQSDGTFANRLTVDAEGLVLDLRPDKVGSGWMSDEYGPYIYHFNAEGEIDGQVLLPPALVPHRPVGTPYFFNSPANLNGRRENQGMEGIAQSPDGTKLFALLQSATLQDSASGNENRFNARLLVYDISGSDTPTDPVEQYVIQLPRIDTDLSGTVDRTGAQSTILALNNHQLLILSRDGNGRGATGAPVFKSVLIAELNGATDIDGTFDAEAAAVAPLAVLNASVTPLAWTEALNILGKLDSAALELAKFNMNINTAPGDLNSLSEKWEALSMVSANDVANPNDYFLFIGNDNDFASQTGVYKDAAGELQSYDAGLENDSIILAYRVRMTGTDNQAPFVANNLVDQSATKGTAFTYTFASDTFADPESQTLTYTATQGDGSPLPAWLTLDSGTRTFSGTPTAVDLGDLVVSVTATDSGTPALFISTSFTISVAPAAGSAFFPQSVASGDPRETSVVLWTRLLDGNTSTNRTVTLHLTSDAGTLADVGTTNVLGGTNVWTGGNLTAESVRDGVVKLKATGLTADTTYYYQFAYNGNVSPIGRTKTAPNASSTRTVRYAAVNCNDFVGRWFNVLKHLCDQEAENLDFIVNLGDYIYETTGDPSFQTTLPERAMVFSNPAEAINLGGGNYAAQSLGNYRDIYKTIRQDEQLQRLHELFPMISIWDDHEFSDDNWKDNATYFDGRGEEQQTTRKRNGETAWMEFLPTERGLDASNIGFEIDAADLYPNTNIQDVFNFGQTLDLITTDNRTFRADHIIPEDALPATIAMDETAVIATLAAANGLDVPTFSANVWPGIRTSFAPYFNVDDGAYAAVKAGLLAIVAGGANTPLSTLPAGITAAYADGAAYAAAKVTGNLDANFVNQLFLAASQPAPFDAVALAAMDRGLSFYLLGKTSFFSDFGSRYQVIDQTFQIYAGYTYQAFVLSGGTQGRNQDFYGPSQLAFLSNALATSTAAWPVVASSTPFTPIKLELGDLPTGVNLPTQGLFNGNPVAASIPNEFLAEFLLNADEPAGFPQYRKGIIDLFAQHDAIIISGDIHAQLVGANRASNGQTVVDFTVPSAASGEFRRAVSSAFGLVEGLVGAQLGGPFVYDTAQKQAVIDATDAIIERNTPEMFKADTAAHGYTVFTASTTGFNADYHKIGVENIDDDYYAQSEALLDGLFTEENFTVQQIGTGVDTDLLLVLNVTVNPTIAGGQGGSVSGGGVLAAGSSAPFTATPDAGYTFAGWIVNGAPAGFANPLSVSVTVGLTVEASFVEVQYPPSNTLTSIFKGFIQLPGSEIPAFDPLSDRAFTSSNTGIQVIDLADPANPVFVSTITPSSLGVSGLTSNDIASIAIRKGSGANPSVLAAAVINSPKTANGHVVFLNAATGALLGSATVGSVPDHISFTPDGTKLLVCNEGEINGNKDATVAAETVPGSVSIVDVTNIASPSVTTAGFASFNASAAALKAAGVRIFNGGMPEFDFEPEYLAISPDGTKAMVTLQEANAVAILDIATATFTSVVPLGEKDFSTLYADFSDRDGPGNTQLRNLTTGNPVFGLYMPDGIASFQAGGQTYYVTANEGDDRDDFLATPETIRVGSGSYDLDDTTFPDEATLKTNARLARLTVSNAPGLRGDNEPADGDIDRILAYGARSFSILDASGAQVFDSGDMIEQIVATQFPALFDDTRSDNKGPEPEGVTVATIGARTFAFVGLERSHMTLAFDVTDPLAPTYVSAFQRTGDLNPEGMVVVAAADSPSGKPLLLVSSEVSNTLSVFEIKEPDFTLQVLHYYGESGLLGVQTAPVMGALIDKFDGDYANTLVLAEGDSFIPGPWLIAGADPSLNSVDGIGSAALGRPDIAIMNLFGTTASALGNHEFDLGSPVLSSAIVGSGAWVGAQFPFITANLNFSADSSLRALADASLGGTAGAIAGQEVTNIKAKIAPYAIKTINGQKIGFVGATTWELLTKSSPNGTAPLDDGNPATSDLQEVAAYLQGAVDALEALGVNKIIQLDQLDTLQRNKDLAGLVSGIDIVVAGGGHEYMKDANDVLGTNSGHTTPAADAYPIQTTGLDGKPVLIVTTDTEYSYLGRLVVDFDSNGELILSNLDDVINGAYPAEDAVLESVYGSGTAATIIAGSSIASGVKAITDAINAVISSKEGNVYGYTNVYLEGDRVFGRTQEVNLGDITADSAAMAARIALSLPESAAVFSLKNAGGIRASIGAIDGSGNKVAPLAISGVKPAGAISQLDIENALRFNNKMMVFDTTPQGLLNILNFAAGLSSGPSQQNGGYPQVGGLRFSYDYSLPAGQRVRSVALYNEAGQLVAPIVANGVVLAGAPATIQCVTGNFTAGSNAGIDAAGGDGYPIKANGTNFRFLLDDGTLSAEVDEALDFDAAANVPANAMGEQKAFQDFLITRHPTPFMAYDVADTPADEDERIVNLDLLPDSVLAALLFDSDGDGLSDADELLLGSNEDSNLRVGDAVNLNVGAFAGVGQTVRVIGRLPTGLLFDSDTGRITGIIRGNPGLYDVQVQVLDANGLVVRTHNLRFFIQAFPSGLLAGYEALLMDAQDFPMGILRLTLSKPGSWSASLQMKNLPARSASGVYTLTAGSPTAELTLPFGPRGAAPATEIQVNLDAAEVTFAGSVKGESIDLAGLRLASRGAAPPAKRRLTMVLDQGEQDGIAYPAGLGWARGDIGTTGSLLLVGQLGDARPFTMSSKLAVTNQTLLWIQSYRNKDSYIGGVAPVPAVGQPAPAGAGLDEGLIWNKAADGRELAYAGGFTAPLSVTAHLSSQIPVRTAAELSTVLGLTDNFIQLEIAGSELSTVPAVDQPLLPTQFLLNPNFTLTVTEPAGSVPLTGRNNKINKSSGGITGSMRITAGSQNLAGKADFSGVILQDASFGSTIGAGLVKIPVAGRRGEYRTGYLLMTP